VRGQRHAQAAHYPWGKTRYPLYRRMCGPQGRSGQVREISPPPPGFDPWTVQPVASRYTDYATRPHLPYKVNVITWLPCLINITVTKCGTYRQTERRDSACFGVAIWLLLYIIAKTEFQSSKPSRYDLRPAIFVKGYRPWWVFFNAVCTFL
jgi:hypothetical protein